MAQRPYRLAFSGKNLPCAFGLGLGHFVQVFFGRGEELVTFGDFWHLFKSVLFAFISGMLNKENSQLAGTCDQNITCAHAHAS